MKISELYPQGPVSAMLQRFDSSPSRWIRSTGRPDDVARQIAAASSSVIERTVTQSNSGSRPHTRVTSSQAQGIASALK